MTFFLREELLDGDPKRPTRRGGRKRSRTRKNQVSKEQQQQEFQQQEEPQKEVNMVNISDFPLTPTQTKLLSKGLSFYSSTHMNWFDLEFDLMQLFRRLKLKVWFANPSISARSVVNTTTSVAQQAEVCLKRFDLRFGSDFLPSVNSPPIETFMDLVKNQAITIKQADKGGAVVV